MCVYLFVLLQTLTFDRGFWLDVGRLKNGGFEDVGISGPNFSKTNEVKLQGQGLQKDNELLDIEIQASYVVNDF